MRFKRQEGNLKLTPMHHWLIFNHLCSRKFAFYKIITKYMGGIDWARDHGAVYQKPNRLPTKLLDQKSETLKRDSEKMAFHSSLIYVCIVILETLLLRKWMPKLAGCRGQFLNCFILIPSIEQVFLKKCCIDTSAFASVI